MNARLQEGLNRPCIWLVKVIIQKAPSPNCLIWRRSLLGHYDLQDGVGGLGNQELQNNAKVSGSGLGEERKRTRSPRHGGMGEEGPGLMSVVGSPDPACPGRLDPLPGTPLNDSNWKTWDCSCFAKRLTVPFCNNQDSGPLL